jgi:hypothetical protein
MSDHKNGSGKSSVKPTPKKKPDALENAVVPEWKPNLDSYKEKRILTFYSEKDLESAIDLLWTEELRELPHDTPDGKSLIMPAEAVPYFTKAGLRFKDKKLGSLKELSPQEIAQLRQTR